MLIWHIALCVIALQTGAALQSNHLIRPSSADHAVETTQTLGKDAKVFIAANNPGEVLRLRKDAFLQQSNQPLLSKMNKLYGTDAILQPTDDMNTVFGEAINPITYLEEMSLSRKTISCFRALISPQAIGRVHTLTRKGWLRNSNSIGVGKALSWRVKQRQAHINPEEADVLVLLGQTKTTLEVYKRLKAKGALNKPILLSLGLSVFPYGIYKLPAPWGIGNRSLLRIDALTRVQDVRLPMLSHVVPFGDSQLSEMSTVFEQAGRHVLLSFVGAVQSTFFHGHLTRSRLDLVRELITAGSALNATRTSDGRITRLFASPFLDSPLLANMTYDRLQNPISHKNWNRLSSTQLSLTLTLYASSVFVLCVAGDTNLRQAIYDAWYMGAVPVVYTKQLPNIQSFYGGLRFQTQADVQAVVVDFPFGPPGTEMLDKLLLMAQTGVAARKQQAIREIVDSFVYRRDEKHPDALSWALGTLVWRKQAGIRKEDLNATALTPWPLMWPECMCSPRDPKSWDQMVYACQNVTCADSFLPPDDW
eukprot:m.48888 g.48888  ORF g.48888 m.48888 type:complete len:534 (+) comp13326_c0_seq3:153-1754(+)